MTCRSCERYKTTILMQEQEIERLKAPKLRMVVNGDGAKIVDLMAERAKRRPTLLPAS